MYNIIASVCFVCDYMCLVCGVIHSAPPNLLENVLPLRRWLTGSVYHHLSLLFSIYIHLNIKYSLCFLQHALLLNPTSQAKMSNLFKWIDISYTMLSSRT